MHTPGNNEIAPGKKYTGKKMDEKHATDKQTGKHDEYEFCAFFLGDAWRVWDEVGSL